MIPAQFLESYLSLFMPFLPFLEKNLELSTQGSTVGNSILIDEEEYSPPLQQIYYSHPSLFMLQDQSKTQSMQYPNYSRKINLDIEPHIELTVLKPSSESHRSPMIITKDGLFDSTRKTNSQFVTIGRQKQCSTTGGLIIPNDVSFQDKGMSQSHCNLLSGRCFSNYFTMKTDFFTFLCIADRRSMSLWSELPTILIKNIFEYLRPLPYLEVIDMGTRTGTYIKVRKDKPSDLILENNYLVGFDTNFHVIGMNSSNKKERDLEYFFQCLAKDLKKGAKVHGLTPKEWKLFHFFVYGKHKRPTKQFRLAKSYRPYLKIEFNNNTLNSVHIFIGDTDGTDSIFRIGRGEDCDIIIPLNIVSRKQCTITYEGKKNKWIIMDGLNNLESANGTWESVQDFSQRQMTLKSESDPKIMWNQSEFKISDTHMKIEFINFSPNKKRKLNPLLQQKYLALG